MFEDAEALVKRAIDNAKSIESEDEHPMQGKCEYEEVGTMLDPFKNATEQDKIQFVKDLETRQERMKSVLLLTACLKQAS